MLEFTVIIQNMRVILYFIYKWEVIVDLNPILLTLWASLSATTQQDGKADGAHLLRCQWIGVGHYTLNIGRLEAGAPSTFAHSG